MSRLFNLSTSFQKQQIKSSLLFYTVQLEINDVTLNTAPHKPKKKMRYSEL